jgi:hypothetical protein
MERIYRDFHDEITRVDIASAYYASRELGLQLKLEIPA